MVVNLYDKKGFSYYYEKISRYKRKWKITIKREMYYIDVYDENGKYYHIQWNKKITNVWNLRRYINKDLLMYSILNIRLNSPEWTLKRGWFL